uniref:Putative salivary secreted peptide n=1 Tax=Lygus hesperus TaxID=30085 RepID=A0A0A9WX32_LYGHE
MSRLIIGMSGGLVLALMLATLAPGPALALDCGRNKSHNSFLGKRWYNDQLLYSTHIIEENKWFRTTTADVYFPARASLKGNITYVELLDQQRDGKGGCGYIRYGGPGYNYTSIHFKSSGWNEGIDFVVRIFGFPSRRR